MKNKKESIDMDIEVSDQKSKKLKITDTNKKLDELNSVINEISKDVKKLLKYVKKIDF